MGNYDSILSSLEMSKFRSSFKITKKERDYIQKKGMKKIQDHAIQFVWKKLSPAVPINDGKQTPMHGHPVFKAMHATGCCCRGCLEKWHHIPTGRELSVDEQVWIVGLLMAWIGTQNVGKNDNVSSIDELCLFDLLDGD